MSATTSKIRVIWLVKGLAAGGAERLLVSFAKVGDHAHFEFSVVYLLGNHRDFVDQIEAAGVPTRCLGGSAGVIDLRWLVRLRRMVRDESIDVVHIHSPLVAAFGRPLVRLMPKATRPKLMYTEHNLWQSYHRLTRLVNRLTMGWDDARLAVSAAVRSSMSARAARRTEVLVHGVEVPELQAIRQRRGEMRTALGLGESDIVVVNVANLKPAKDHRSLLRAARLVLDTDDRFTFLCIGQGPDLEALRLQADDLGVGERVRFLGYRPDVSELLSAADVFCLSSQWEGLPIALLEALAMGLPAVCTAVGGIPSAVTDGIEGRLVPPRDPSALAEALLSMADGERRAAMGRAASRRGSSFDVQIAVDRQQEIYRELVDGRPAPAGTVRPS